MSEVATLRIEAGDLAGVFPGTTDGWPCRGYTWMARPISCESCALAVAQTS